MYKQKNNLNVLMVSAYFYPEGGGTETYVYNISKGLVRRGHNVTILCSTHRREDKEEVINGIRIIRLKPDFFLSNTPIKFNLFFTMSKFIKENHFDLINAHAPVPYYPDTAAIVSKFQRIPFILTYHAGGLKKGVFLLDILAQLYQNTIEKIMLKHANKIIIYNEFVRDCYLSNYKLKITFAFPGIDTQIFKPLDNKLNKNKRILFVGQLTKAHKWKGLLYLLKAMKIVIKKNRSVHLIVVGGGNYIDFYKSLSEELGLKDYVTFVGNITHEKIAKYYQAADLLVLPSYSNAESFGFVLIEAMACGKPVIGTKVGGIPYVVRDGENGLLVPPKDSEALSDAIIKLLRDSELAKRLGKRGYKMVKEDFTWEKSVESTVKIFEGVI